MRPLDLGRWGAAGCLAAVAALSSPASAQFGDLAGFTESMQREYLNRDLVLFEDSLQLDKAQRDILESLYDDYKADFDAGLSAMQERLKNMKEQLQAGDQKRILTMIFVPFVDWADDRRQLGQEFIGTVEAILNEEQMDLMPGFLRRLEREKTLSKGHLSGETTNLLLVTRQMNLDPSTRATIQPLLDEYELALHDALVRRNEVVRETQAQTVQALQDQDAQKNLTLMDRQLAARTRLRDVNDQYTDIITNALPAAPGNEFHQLAMERGYARAYRSTAAERMYDAAVKLSDLDPEILQSIIDLQEVYLAELDIFRRGLVDVIRRYEPQRERNRVEMFAARMDGQKIEKVTDPTLAELRKRDKLDDQYILLLQSLLTDEQFRSLPGAERWLKRRMVKDRPQKDPKNQKNQRSKQRKGRPTPGKPNLGSGKGRTLDSQ